MFIFTAESAKFAEGRQSEPKEFLPPEVFLCVLCVLCGEIVV